LETNHAALKAVFSEEEGGRTFSAAAPLPVSFSRSRFLHPQKLAGPLSQRLVSLGRPWPEPVDGSQLHSALVQRLVQFIELNADLQ